MKRTPGTTPHRRYALAWDLAKPKPKSHYWLDTGFDKVRDSDLPTALAKHPLDPDHRDTDQ